MRTRTKLGSFFDSKHGDSESDCVHTVTAGWGGGGGTKYGDWESDCAHTVTAGLGLLTVGTYVDLVNTA